MSWAEEAAALNASVLSEFGTTVEHTPTSTGIPTEIVVSRSDPTELSAAGVLLTLFGDVTASGFATTPVKNDAFEVDGVAYRAFDVQGPDETGGIHIHLTR